MEKRTIELIHMLGEEILASKLKQPIHLVTVCSGGRQVGQSLEKYFKSKNVDAKYYEVWTDIKDRAGTIRESAFKKDDYIGTALIVDDVIWSGTVLKPVLAMVKKMKPSKKCFIATLLDCNNKADFAVFR